MLLPAFVTTSVRPSRRERQFLGPVAGLEAGAPQLLAGDEVVGGHLVAPGEGDEEPSLEPVDREAPRVAPGGQHRRHLAGLLVEDGHRVGAGVGDEAQQLDERQRRDGRGEGGPEPEPLVERPGVLRGRG